jgi:nucleoside 2-deoxyribosyltransferase
LRLLHGQQRVRELQQRMQQLQFSLDASSNSKPDNKGTTGELKPSAVAESSAIFVIMPFDESFSDVWAGAIQRAARAEGYDAIRVDMINRSSDITDDIIEAITNCHVAIVDVTGANANVMFELGYAFAKEKPQVIISQSAEFLPFDIRNLRTVIYRNTWAGIEELSVRLIQFLREIPKVKLRKKTRVRSRLAPRKTRFEAVGTANGQPV